MEQNKVTLVCVEQLIGRLLIDLTRSARPETLHDFEIRGILLPFGQPKVIVSDDAIFFGQKVKNIL